MAISPLAGQPARAVRSGERAAPGDGLFFGSPGSASSRASGFRSELRAIAARRSIGRSTSGTFWRSRRRFALIGRRTASTGRCFSGIDTHALSEPAFASALEVLAANDVQVMIAPDGEYTPTPAISHAILNYNRDARRRAGRRHRDHAVAQSARGWRLQIQSTARRAGGQRRSRSLFRTGRMNFWSAAWTA